MLSGRMEKIDLIVNTKGSSCELKSLIQVCVCHWDDANGAAHGYTTWSHWPLPLVCLMPGPPVRKNYDHHNLHNCNLMNLSTINNWKRIFWCYLKYAKLKYIETYYPHYHINPKSDGQHCSCRRLLYMEDYALFLILG